MPEAFPTFLVEDSGDPPPAPDVVAVRFTQVWTEIEMPPPPRTATEERFRREALARIARDLDRELAALMVGAGGACDPHEDHVRASMELLERDLYAPTSRVDSGHTHTLSAGELVASLERDLASIERNMADERHRIIQREARRILRDVGTITFTTVAVGAGGPGGPGGGAEDSVTLTVGHSGGAAGGSVGNHGREQRTLAEVEEAQTRAQALLRDWLSPAQREQYDKHKHFEVVGCHTGKRYRVHHCSSTNIEELAPDGSRAAMLCFAPEGYLPTADIMLAQKIALETDEEGALAVANRWQRDIAAPPLVVVEPVAAGGPRGTWGENLRPMWPQPPWLSRWFGGW